MGFIEKVKRTGIRYSLAILLGRVVPAWLFRRRKFVILEIDLGAFRNDEFPTASSSERNTDLTVFMADSPELIEQACELTLVRSPPQDSKAWCARTDGSVAAGLWLVNDSFPESELGLLIELPKHCCWLFSARVDPPHRNKRLYSNLVDQVFRQISMETKSIFLAVNPLNVRSYCVHQKLATKEVGTVSASRFWRMNIVRASGDVSLNRPVSLDCTKNPVRVRLGLVEYN